jgi:hypothetical protein
MSVGTKEHSVPGGKKNQLWGAIAPWVQEEAGPGDLLPRGQLMVPVALDSVRVPYLLDLNLCSHGDWDPRAGPGASYPKDVI